MTYEELYRLIAGRLRSAGIVEASSGQVDIGEVQLSTLSVLNQLVQAYDLDAFTVYSEYWFATEAEEARYDLPADFGRLITPREPGESGVFIRTAENLQSELLYEESRELAEQVQTTPGTPGTFSLVHPGQMWLSPAPDDNAGENYTVGGVYIRRIDAGALRGLLPEPLPSALEHLVVGQLAADKQVNNPHLQGQAAEARSQFINAQARRRQRFQRRTRDRW